MNSANEQDFHSCENKAAACVNTTGGAEMDILWQQIHGWNNDTFVHLACILTEIGALAIVGAPAKNTVSGCMWMDNGFLY